MVSEREVEDKPGVTMDAMHTKGCIIIVIVIVIVDAFPTVQNSALAFYLNPTPPRSLSEPQPQCSHTFLPKNPSSELQSLTASSIH